MANCSICGKKIRWWQKSMAIPWRRMKRVEVDGVVACIPDNQSRMFFHQKCKPSALRMAIFYPGMDYGYLPKSEDKP